MSAFFSNLPMFQSLEKSSELVFPASKPSWIIRSHSLRAISSRGTVRSGLNNRVPTVLSPDDCHRIWPILMPQSCSHTRSCDPTLDQLQAVELKPVDYGLIEFREPWQQHITRAERRIYEHLSHHRDWRGLPARRRVDWDVASPLPCMTAL
jgi:hypothetical protein